MAQVRILGEHDLTLRPLRIESKKPRRKTGLLQGYVLLFGGSDGGPHGPRWLI